MPKSIQYTGREGRAYNAPPSSRYARTPVINYDGRLTYPIYKKEKPSISSREPHYEITPDVAYRPDLVSYKFYGAPDFWWKIMEINGMKDILEFRPGRNIILPSGSILF